MYLNNVQCYALNSAMHIVSGNGWDSPGIFNLCPVSRPPPPLDLSLVAIVHVNGRLRVSSAAAYLSWGDHTVKAILCDINLLTSTGDFMTMSHQTH